MLRPLLGAAALPLLLSGPAMAAQTQRAAAPPPITVLAGQETMEQWTVRVSQRLNSGLAYPQPILANDVHEGLVKVVFHCDEAGRPAQVALLQSSGARDLDRAAMMAVKRISTLHPLPEGLRSERGFQAWILFSKDEESFARRMNDLRQQAQLANAARYQQDQTADAGPVILLASR